MKRVKIRQRILSPVSYSLNWDLQIRPTRQYRSPGLHCLTVTFFKLLRHGAFAGSNTINICYGYYYYNYYNTLAAKCPRSC